MEDELSVDMEPMVDFWGVELTGKQRKAQWPKSEEEAEPDVTVRLELRQACLGAKAKTGERNVVELTAEDENGQEVTHTILSLCVGGTEQSPLFLEVFPPVTFHLASGSGPLHIVGSVHTEVDDITSDEEEEEDSNASESLPELMKSRKRAAESPPNKAAAKTLKLAKENGETSETSVDQEDSEEESDEEEEDSEESEEEQEEKSTPLKATPVSKPKVKSAQKPPKHVEPKPQFKTPQSLKRSKTSGKVTLSAPTTPEQTKSAKKVTKKKRSKATKQH